MGGPAPPERMSGTARGRPGRVRCRSVESVDDTASYLPQRNAPDLDDVPADVLAALTVHIVSDVREILGTALEPVSADAVASV